MRSVQLLTLLFYLALSACNAQESMIDKSVSPYFELDRYLGTWYEIARYDHRFERGMDGVTATYSLREDGLIKVENKGCKGGLDGKLSTAIGKAKVPNPDQPSKLKVSFFWFFYGDYYVLELDPDYQWALIGSSSDNYLWILSRKAHIRPDLYQELIAKLKARGYDTDKLIRVEHASHS